MGAGRLIKEADTFTSLEDKQDFLRGMAQENNRCQRSEDKNNMFGEGYSVWVKVRSVGDVAVGQTVPAKK